MLLFRSLLAPPRAGSFPKAPPTDEADSDQGKEQRGNVNDYEILLMLDPETPEERHNEIIARTRELVEKGGGSWLSHDPWGRRRLAFEIDHKTDGVYHLLQFDAEPATLDEISRVLKITDGVVRHMATRRPKGGGRTGPPPPLAPPEPERRAARDEPEAAVAPAAVAPAAAAEAGADTAAPEGYAEPTEPASEEPASEEGA
jgi:small subunit ribosomal protein S6